MKIDANQLAWKKQVGRDGQDQVWAIATKGGLHLLVAKRDGGRVETLGAGSHKAIALHIAKKKAPGLVLTELSKSDWVPEEAYLEFLPKYEELTSWMRVQKGFDP